MKLKIPTPVSFVRRLAAILLIYSGALSAVYVRGQDPAPVSSQATQTQTVESAFRVEKTLVPGGSEIVTIFSRQSFFDHLLQGPVTEIPLLSVLRDTLGDDIPENDRLRYVWMHNYAEPSLSQKISAFVPFLYTRTTNKGKVGTGPPPPIADIQIRDRDVINGVLWSIFKRLVLGELRIGVKAPAFQYSQNKADYRRSAVAGAMTVLSMYQTLADEKVLSDTEVHDIQARLSLSDRTLGWHMESENLDRVYQKEMTLTRDIRGHNWELLRQYTEAQGLYFEPLEMPDGTARHAMVWINAADIEANKGRKFESRFLNIKNPWMDSKLSNWKGYSQVRWYDADDRIVDPGTIGAKPRTLIPLALYGLDHPKIPAILVDFRDNGNAKKREISHRILRDITGNVLSLSQFSSLPYFFGRFIYDFVTGRRGADINQASRLRSYSQLKLMLSLDASLDPDFRNDIADRVESATLNPLQNDSAVEARLARSQYANLMAYAKRPDGLPKQIENDRREEMVMLKHGTAGRTLFGLAHTVTLGLYTHREKDSPEMQALMAGRRQLDFHERHVREVAFASADPEIDSNMDDLRRSLAFISENGSAAKEKTTRALAKIFKVSGAEDIRRLCLSGLYKINNSSAKKELLAIHGNDQVSAPLRNLCARYLKLALEEGQRISARDAHEIAGLTAN